MEYQQDQYTPDQYTPDQYLDDAPEAILRNEDVVENYTKKLKDADAYSFSLQESKDLHAASMTVSPPSQDDSGIPEDLGNAPINTPNIKLGEEEKEPDSLLMKAWNYIGEDAQRVVYPFLAPFMKGTQEENFILRGTVSGVVQGANNTLDFLRDINNAMHPDNQFSEEEWLKLPQILESSDDSTGEAIVNGFAQFVSVYSALGKLGKGQELSGRGAKIFNDMWRGGIADAMFDPEEGNLATLLNSLDEDTTKLGIPFGKLQGPLTEWLGTPVGEDAEAWERLEQRAKSALEGGGIGFATHSLMFMLRGMKEFMLETDPEAFFKVLRQAGISDTRIMLMENKQGAENIITPPLNELGMYSQLEKALLNITQDTNKADDLLRYLRKNEVSESELEDSGILKYLQDNKGKSLSRDEVMAQFKSKDVTQSYESTTRQYEEPSDIESMTDEEDLLTIYQGGDVGHNDNINGRVLDHNEMDENIQSHADDIRHELETGSYGEHDVTSIRRAMAELYPEKYGYGIDPTKDFDEFNLKLGSMYGGNNYKPELHPNPEEFRQHVDEAAELIAKQEYDAAPVFQWDLNEGNFYYTISGNEDYGYNIKVWDDISRTEVELDVASSANEAMVKVQQHNMDFGSGAVRTGDETRWHDYIVNDDVIDTYKETIITADSPTKDIFDGGKGMTHFPDDNQVFHLRTTEPDANTLFIEELQSDWNNAISKKGIKKGEAYNQSTRKALQDAVAERNTFLETTDWKFSGHRLMGEEEELVPRNFKSEGKHHLEASDASDALWKNTSDDIKDQIIAHNKIVNDLKDKVKAEAEAVPKSPLPNDKWISVGLRKAIAMAIENGQTRVEWTTSAQQVSQWGKGTDGNFEKMYINLYDKKMPSIAKRIANKYNSRAALHYIIINDEMIKHHKSGKGSKLRAAAPVGLTASEAVKEKEDKS
jgi:hypothetical protein